MASFPSRALTVSLALAILPAALLACTTRTEIVHRVSPTESGDPVAEEPPGEDDETTGGEGDERDGGAGAGRDASKPPPPPPPPPSGGDAGSGSTITGGKISLTCPASGFHKPPPVVIASLPTSLLPRCSSATKACAYAAATAQAYDACLDADTTPPVTHDGESVDCKACDRTQGSYCLASACKSQFADYACCAQDKGDAACAPLLDAVTSCAGTTGKAAFEACIGALVSACFD